MKIGRLAVRLATTDHLGDHIQIKLTNTEAKEFFSYNPASDSVVIRLKLDTAIQLSQFIDETVDTILDPEEGLKAIAKK